MQGGNNGEIVMYTTAWCPACWQAKQVMKSMKVDFQEINISDDEEATLAVQKMNNGYRSVPTIIFPDGSILTEPRTTTLVQKLQSFV